MATNTTRLTRRSFSTWLAASGFVLTTARRTSAQDLIESEPFLPFVDARRPSDLVANDSNKLERWTAVENESWQWYERESLLHGQWKLTGMTRPVNRVTGECLEAMPEYLDESLVPFKYRRVDHGSQQGQTTAIRSELPLGPESYGYASPERRAHDGRPPSEWLRSMEVEELQEWLAKIEVSEAGVQGMTFWTHLTRDHLFRPLLIKGLTEAEQAKLHAAAHYGY